MSIQGIDLSNNNGVADWAQWRDVIGFAMMKATEGAYGRVPTYFDTQFARNWDQAWRLHPNGSLIRIAYHFAHPAGDPVSQADCLTSVVRRHGLRPGDHFALDLEVSDGMPPEHVAKWAQTFAHRINHVNPGHRCIIYTYPAFADEGNCDGLHGWPLWIADYGVSVPAVPAPWREWTFWQYSGTGTDRDVYPGTLAELQDFAWMPGSRR